MGIDAEKLVMLAKAQVRRRIVHQPAPLGIAASHPDGS
jgi:hypothetical protein